jgi:hypothetical protein
LRHAFSKRARFLRVHRLADRELVERDDSLALVPDVYQHLVLVDPDDAPADDVALLEGNQRGVVVGNDLAVDLEQKTARALDDPLRGRRLYIRHCGA